MCRSTFRIIIYIYHDISALLTHSDFRQNFQPHLLMPQRRIAIMSNSGGVGKTTLAVNLAYQLARCQKSVAVFGCDPNGSLTLFCGLEDPPDAKKHIGLCFTSRV